MTSLQGTRRGAWLCKQGEEFLFSTQERAVFSLHWIQYEKLKVLRYVRGRNKKRVKAQGKRSKCLAEPVAGVRPPGVAARESGRGPQGVRHGSGRGRGAGRPCPV